MDSRLEELRSECLNLERLLSAQNHDDDPVHSIGRDIDGVGLALFD